MKRYKDMDYMVDLNLKASFHVAQLASRKMLKSKNRKKQMYIGSIINMSSQLAQSWITK